MNMNIPGLVATMIVMSIVFAMIGLIFNITLKTLNEQRIYSEFSLEVQRLVSTIDSLLVQSVWSNTISASNNRIVFDFFVPHGSSVIKQSKTLVIESGTILFDGKKVGSVSSLISSVTFALENIQGKKFILMSVKPSNPKFKTYNVPLLTGLSESN